jgi:peptidoglycan glycosyltransferase
MKKVKRRTMAVLVLIILIIAGMGLYLVKYFMSGAEWASSRVNGNAYSGGRLISGTVVDRNGVVLTTVKDGVRVYAEDSSVRRATLHIVGDKNGNIGTGALKVYSSKLLGYNPITGLYSFSDEGATVKLSIDSELNSVALAALDGRSGTVAVMNYETGEILCEVSTPTFDPENPPEIGNDDTSGVYINRFLSSTFTPGSVYKLVTLAAAIENIDDLYEREFYCEGSLAIGNDNVVCTKAHGSLKIEDALAVSCNCVFAQLSMELGADTMEEYADRFGLTSSQSVDGIKTAAGNYDKSDADIDVAWSGVGQYNDLVNPAAMLRFVAAIANSGKAPDMTQLKSGIGIAGKERLMSASTSEKISDIMNYCVSYTYGNENFPGLELYAKSGTAEVGGDSQPNAWFVGFIKNTDHPLCFVVVIENGGWGSSAAGSVANKVLQAAISDN